MKTVSMDRILKNLSYVPRKPHGFYRVQGGGQLAYSSNPHITPTKNIFNLHAPRKRKNGSTYKMYVMQHKQIASKQREFNMLKKKGEAKLTKQDAIQIWSFVKAMTRNILDRTHELLVSERSYITRHGPDLINYLASNCVIRMELFRKFQKNVNDHVKPIITQTEFFLKHIRYYRNAILDIMKMRIQGRKTYLKISKYIKQYFSNIHSIMTNVTANLSNLMKYTKEYKDTISGYHDKYCPKPVGRRIRTPSESEKAKDVKKIMKAFYKLKNSSDRNFMKLLEQIRLRERLENSANMRMYKEIISRSNQKLPL